MKTKKNLASSSREILNARAMQDNQETLEMEMTVTKAGRKNCNSLGIKSECAGSEAFEIGRVLSMGMEGHGI